LAENETLFCVEVPKEAVPVGTVFGVQLLAVSKSAVPVEFHVASWAANGRTMPSSA